MSFSDGSYAYVLFKEAFHHFPRPMIALYEMLRAVRKGVVLIELNNIGNDVFEGCGSYVYSLSWREAIKVALALCCPCIAFKGFNDGYIRSVEHERLSAQTSLLRKNFKK